MSRLARDLPATELDPFMASIFLAEIHRQVRFGYVASGDLVQATRDASDEERLWYSLQGILIAAANVSKLLWPPKARYAARGNALRSLLGVTDDSPLGPDRARKLRNQFEHFDEKIEEWADGLASSADVYLDSHVGSLAEISIPGLTPERVMRHFDPEDWSLWFRGVGYPLRPIQQALAELGPRVEAARGRVWLSRSDRPSV